MDIYVTQSIVLHLWASVDICRWGYIVVRAWQSLCMLKASSDDVTFDL